MNDTPPDGSAAPAEEPVAADDDEAEDSGEPESEPRRRARWLVTALVVGLVVIPAAVGVVGTRIIGVWGSDSEPTPEATGSPEPTEPPSPFDGTPAENFAEGAAGIVLPEAEPVGDFTADEVADALEQVRDALIAARLDRSMLVGHDRDILLTLLIADQQAALRGALDSGEFGAFPTQIADGAVLAVPPRVKGRVTYEAVSDGPDRSLIEVVTRFVWVYAFQGADAESTAHLVAVRDELVWQVRGEPWLESSQGLSLYNVALQVWGADCKAHDQGVLRPDGEGLAGLDEKADVIFDPEQPLDSDNPC